MMLQIAVAAMKFLFVQFKFHMIIMYFVPGYLKVLHKRDFRENLRKTLPVLTNI